MVMVNRSRLEMQHDDVVRETYVQVCGYNKVCVQESVVRKTTENRKLLPNGTDLVRRRCPTTIDRKQRTTNCVRTTNNQMVVAETMMMNSRKDRTMAEEKPKCLEWTDNSHKDRSGWSGGRIATTGVGQPEATDKESGVGLRVGR